MTQFLVYDIGGTNLKYALMDHAGQILEQAKRPTPRIGDEINWNPTPAEKQEQLSLFVNAMDEIADQYVGQFDGVAVCAPGKIDVNEKIIHFGGALPFLDGFNLQAHFAKKYGVPVGAENDGKAAALAEMWLGELKGVRDGFAFTLGSGVGGGIVANGQLIHGAHFQAGELSAMFYQPKSGNNFDQMVGSVCSGVGLVERINQAIGHADLKDGLAAFAAVEQGQKQAQQILAEYAQSVAIMILNVQTVIDGEKVVVSGGISAQPALVKAINEAYDQLLADNPIIKTMFTRPQIVTAKFANNANLYGALYSLLLDLNHEN